MSIKAITIIDAAQEILQDMEGVSYEDEQGLDWVNRGQRAIVNLRRDAGALTTTWQMTAGAKQTLAPGYIQIMGDVRNMGDDGSTPGSAVFRAERVDLDSIYPGWANDENQAEAATDYMFDIDNPRVFYVNPPSDGTGYLEATVSQVPADITDEIDDITIPDQFEMALIHFVCWCWLGRDDEKSPNYARAQAYASSFLNLLGISESAKRAVEAKT